jgi:hypothetical protein
MHLIPLAIATPRALAFSQMNEKIVQQINLGAAINPTNMTRMTMRLQMSLTNMGWKATQ